MSGADHLEDSSGAVLEWVTPGDEDIGNISKSRNAGENGVI